MHVLRRFATAWWWLLARFDFHTQMTSTNNATPAGEAREVFDEKPCAVLGFGCTSYPRFCAAADTFQSLVCATGAQPVMPVTKVRTAMHAVAQPYLPVTGFCRTFQQTLDEVKAWKDVVRPVAQEATPFAELDTFRSSPGGGNATCELV
jgi:hypothetical protein